MTVSELECSCKQNRTSLIPKYSVPKWQERIDNDIVFLASDYLNGNGGSEDGCG